MCTVCTCTCTMYIVHVYVHVHVYNYCFYIPVPDVLQCGHCLVDGHTTLSFHCLNSGGEGNFRIMTQIQKDEKESTLEIGPFSITPTEFYLGHGDFIDINVSYIFTIITKLFIPALIQDYISSNEC